MVNVGSFFSFQKSCKIFAISAKMVEMGKNIWRDFVLAFFFSILAFFFSIPVRSLPSPGMVNSDALPLCPFPNVQYDANARSTGAIVTLPAGQGSTIPETDKLGSIKGGDDCQGGWNGKQKKARMPDVFLGKDNGVYAERPGK